MLFQVGDATLLYVDSTKGGLGLSENQTGRLLDAGHLQSEYSRRETPSYCCLRVRLC